MVVLDASVARALWSQVRRREREDIRRFETEREKSQDEQRSSGEQRSGGEEEIRCGELERGGSRRAMEASKKERTQERMISFFDGLNK